MRVKAHHEQRRDRKAVHSADLSGLGADLHRPAGDVELDPCPRAASSRGRNTRPRPSRRRAGRTSAWWSRGCRTRRNCRCAERTPAPQAPAKLPRRHRRRPICIGGRYARDRARCDCRRRRAADDDSHASLQCRAGGCRKPPPIPRPRLRRPRTTTPPAHSWMCCRAPTPKRRPPTSKRKPS